MYTKYGKNSLKADCNNLKMYLINPRTNHINKMKNESHMIISTDVEETSDKTRQPFMIKKKLSSTWVWRDISQHNKGHL